jgi:hypothetical protein
MEIKLNFFKSKIAIYLSIAIHKAPKLQENPSALKREPPALPK